MVKCGQSLGDSVCVKLAWRLHREKCGRDLRGSSHEVPLCMSKTKSRS